MAAVRAGARRRGSLVIVGTGIKLTQHTTLEALGCIERAEKLFYLAPNPLVGVWLRGLNPSAESLADSYAEGKPRDKTYREITARILSAVRAHFQVCAAFYGHPGVLVDSAHSAIHRARREGFAARMLPGISTEDCLFAEIDVNSGDGWQCFEATDFLMSKRKFDPSSALILWQVGLLGEPSVRKEMSCRIERLQVLTSVLRQQYPARHPVVLYEASQFPICDSVVRRTSLARLHEQTIRPETTLYLPGRASPRFDARVARWMSE